MQDSSNFGEGVQTDIHVISIAMSDRQNTFCFLGRQTEGHRAALPKPEIEHWLSGSGLAPLSRVVAILMNSLLEPRHLPRHGRFLHAARFLMQFCLPIPSVPAEPLGA